MTKYIILITLVAAITIGVSSTVNSNPRKPVEFYTGHRHVGDVTIDAPQHSGGTDSYGCHNRSVPYHCH